MARVTGPLFSLDASGTIASALNFTRNLAGGVARRVPRTRKPATAAQQAQRDRYRTAAALWASLSPEEKATYADAGRRAAITAFSAYMSAALSAPEALDTLNTEAGDPLATEDGNDIIID